MELNRMVFCVAALALSGAAFGDAIDEALKERPGLYAKTPCATHIFDATLMKVGALDRRAERVWAELKTPDAIAAHRARLHERMAAAVGGFPERTPLNVRSCGVVPRDGYTIEKLVFESRPRHYVTALLFLPKDPRFAAPYPGVVVTCGHNVNGKNAQGNQRACVVLAKYGVASLIFDPIDQGERQQLPGTDGLMSVGGHTHVGLRAMLVGWGTAQFRIWDGIRAHDVLAARPEVDAARIGVTGMSGGGTMSSYLNAFDLRYRAAAPMGYLTSIRALGDRCGPQDCEQIVYGQLAFGLNHLSLLLMNGASAVCPGFTYGDLFPYEGSMETYEQAQAFCAREGRADQIDVYDCPGPHAWFESEKHALARWMRRHLAGDASAWPTDKADLRRLDVGFDYATADVGLAETPASNVLGGRGVMSLPGARSVYDLVIDRLDALEKARPKTLDLAEVKAVCALAADGRAVPLAVRTAEADGLRIVTALLEQPDATRVPVAAFLPARPTGAPVLLATDAKCLADLAGRVRALVAEGRPVAVAEARGFGSVTSCWARGSYWQRKGADQEIAAFLAWCGESLAIRRAEDYLAAGAWFRDLLGASAELRAEGRAVVAAAHAYAFGRDRFARFAAADAPPSWRETIHAPRAAAPRISDVVFGALAVYDWPDLVRE